MTTTMDPPPPRNPNPSHEPPKEPEAQPKSGDDEPETSTKVTMGPPPPLNPKLDPMSTGEQEKQQKQQKQELRGELNTDSSVTAFEQPKPVQLVKQSSVPYSIPDWSGPPCHHFYLEVLREGSIVNQFDVIEKGAYMFGRADICDFVLEHPTISRFHAVLQFNKDGDAYLYDLGSTHGTFINKSQVKKREYVDLHVGDVIRFGCSTRLYIFQGPPDLMPAAMDISTIKESKTRQKLLDREASLKRARLQATMADGISWGMGEDAIEEAEDDGDEITWQTHKGLLTEKQEKTKEKIIKRMEKIGHMKKEINAIRVKDISQGGLTQGQQTQIARNEQRIAQLMEELENLEETLDESIRESIGARSGKISHGKRKGTTADDEELLSDDDDDFYDRTKKKPSSQKDSEAASVETAETLLDKRDVIMKDIEEKKILLSLENNKLPPETTPETEAEAGDALDAYMSGVSTQLVLDKTTQIQNEISALQSELNRILYLLKLADPSEEAAKKRDSILQIPKPSSSKAPTAVIKKHAPTDLKTDTRPGKPATVPEKKEVNTSPCAEQSIKSEAIETGKDAVEEETVVYSVQKPQWLGAVQKMEPIKAKTEAVVTNEADEFVDYKDRNKILRDVNDAHGLENAAPGLIIRKRKQEETLEAGSSEVSNQSMSTSDGAENVAHDAVALLLKHSRGYHAEVDDELEKDGRVEKLSGNQPSKKKKKSKKVLGPEKPSFLNADGEFESWVPPKGQSGDGRTSLNDRYGY